MMRPPRRVLLAALGATLRGDDGFGPRLLARLAPALPPWVTVRDFGTHGLALVQALYDGFDALVVLDACRRGGRPGSVYTIRPHIPSSIDDISAHMTGPSAVFAMARRLDVLPPDVWLVGCEPLAAPEYHLGLSRPVRRALPRAAEAVNAILQAAA